MFSSSRLLHRLIQASMVTIASLSGWTDSRAAQYFPSTPFTTSRVTPAGTQNAWPWRAAGQLFFTDPATGLTYKCSGAVVAPRLVLTAAHCLFHAAVSPSDRRIFQNFVFVPGASPTGGQYGSWTGSKAFVKDAWYTSSGTVPNAADYGLLQIENGPVSIPRRRSPSQGAQASIGNYVGWLGWRISALSGTMTTVLGYPCNLDGCTQMQVTVAPAVTSVTPGLFFTGTAMGFGAEGGPAIVGFGEAPSSTIGFGLGTNEIRGVFERTFADWGYEYGYTIELDQGFSDLFRLACTSTVGNC